jgi:hypothetical protein
VAENEEESSDDWYVKKRGNEGEMASKKDEGNERTRR